MLHAALECLLLKHCWGLQALTGDAGALQPHYGSRAAGRLTDAAHQWFTTQLPAIEAADGSALASLRDNLQQLSSSAQGSLEVRSYPGVCNYGKY